MRFVCFILLSAMLSGGGVFREAGRIASSDNSEAVLSLPAESHGREPTFTLSVDPQKGIVGQSVDGALFSSPTKVGWQIDIHLRNLVLNPGTTLFTLASEGGQNFLEGLVTDASGDARIALQLHTDYNPAPLVVGIPVKLIASSNAGDLLLRYEGFRLDLFYNGVLVDTEWPIGHVNVGKSPMLHVSAPVDRISVWSSPSTDEDVVAMNEGSSRVAAETVAMLGQEPQRIQYSRPRGYNTNAGDAMPFYHDGTFHLFYLFDRRQHHSKWRLGAHQWAHISSTDLIHWKHEPFALSIDHEWEGSICTGSVFFHDGQYFAYYATRLPDRSERLAVALSKDGIHFSKQIPTPFAEPQIPFIHGPNRDPFVFEADNRFHMIVTAAIENGSVKNEGALEHLVSSNLKEWAVAKEPFITSGSQAQPECSDLFRWNDWYYLLFSVSGTTHYRISKSPLGPWQTPASDILDGPEATVMKAAPFKGNRMLIVGFVSHDHQYGGDLVFRELVQEGDGSLGSKIPHEMELAAGSLKTTADIHLTSDSPLSTPIDLASNARIAAAVSTTSQSSLTLRLGMSTPERPGDELTFDPVSASVTWTDPTGNAMSAKLEHVTDLSKPFSFVLILYGSVADLSINGHRTLIHRLSSDVHPSISFSGKGDGVDVSHISEAPIL